MWKMPIQQNKDNLTAAQGDQDKVDLHLYLESFKYAPSALAITTRKEGRIIEINEAVTRLLGYSSVECIGKTTDELHIWAEIKDRNQVIGLLNENGKLVNFDTRMRTKSGEILHVFVTAIYHPIDGIESVIWQINQFSEIGKMELMLAEREHQLSSLMSNLPGVAYKCLNDASWTMKFISDGVRDLTGFESSDFIDNSRIKFIDIIHLDDRQLIRDEIEERLEKRERYKLTYRIITADNKQKWVWEQGNGIFDDKGNVIALEGFITDITERKNADLLIQREAMMNSIIAGLASVLMQPAISMIDICELVLAYSKMATNSLEGVVFISEGRILPETTSASSELFNNLNVAEFLKNMGQILGKSENRPISSFSNAAIDLKVRGLINDTDNLDVALKNYIHVPLSRTGELAGHLLLLNSEREFDDHDIRVLENIAYLLQVSFQQYKTHVQLQNSESRYRSLVEDQTDFVVRWKPDGRILFVNNPFSLFLGITEKSYPDTSFFSYCSGESTGDLNSLLKEIHPGKPIFVFECLASKEGLQPYWHQWSNRGLFDEYGALKEIQSVGRDITSRKRYETEIQRRINQEKLISLISASFVSSSIDDTEASINKALSLVGRYFDADHCYLLKFNDDISSGIISNEWFSDDIVVDPKKSNRLNLHDAGQIITKIINREHASILDPESMREADVTALMEIMISGVKHLIYAPTHSQGKSIGYLGIERSRDGIPWDQTTVQAMDLLGEILSQLLQRVRQEKAYRESEANFRAMVESSHDPLIIINDQSTVVWINEAVHKVTGYSQETLGNLFEKILDEDLPIVMNAWDAVYAGNMQSVQDLDVRFYHLSKRVLYMKISIVRTERSGTAIFFLSAHDVTLLKESELLIKQSQERYLNLFDNMRNGVAIYEPIKDGTDFIIKDFNKAAERIDHVLKDDAVGKKVTEVFPGIEKSGIFSAFQKAYRQGTPVEIGSTHYQDSRIDSWRENYIYRLSSGEIVTVYSDITEKMVAQERIQQAEARVRKSEEKYRLITESSNDLISIVTREFRIEYINESVFRLLGYRAEDLIGKSHLGLVFPDDIKKVLEVLASIRGNGSSETILEVRLHHKNGEFVWFETKTRKITYEGEMKLLFVSRDITSRKLAEAQLQESESRYRIMLENASDMVSLLDDNMCYEFVNQNQLKILSYEREELIGKSVVDFIHPDDLECSIEEFMCSFMKGEGSGEFRLKHKDGYYIWFETKGTTYLDNHGNRKALMLSRDVSESKRMKDELLKLNQELENRVEERTYQLRAAQERLIRQEKLAAVGKIAGTISHELRNPLGAIGNSIYFLNMKLSDADEKVRKHIGSIQNAVDRARRIITDLLDFTRIKQPDFITGDIVPIIKVALAQVTMPPGINARFDAQPASILIKMDPALLQQAFINLITNAVQAMQQGGSIVITLSTSEDRAIILFQDSGVGIPKENMAHLFEPLFSTKKAGIGLGLSLVKDIVDKHEGSITVESEVNQGTTFQLSFPFKPQPV
jgi:PAS domain S-box-containing protein